MTESDVGELRPGQKPGELRPALPWVYEQYCLWLRADAEPSSLKNTLPSLGHMTT